MQHFQIKRFFTVTLSSFMLLALTACETGSTEEADTTPPRLTLQGSEVLEIVEGTSFVDPGAKAVDDEDGDLTDRITVKGHVDTNQEGVYTLIYIVTDSAGNEVRVRRTVKVLAPPPVDKTPPQITLLGENPMRLSVGEAFKDPGATAKDDVDGDLSGKITLSGKVDTKKEGEYTLTYSVTDSAGNSATARRVVKVVPAPDTTPPTLTLKGEATITISVGEKFVDPGAEAMDDRDGDISARIKVEGDVDSSREGTYLLTYSVTDSAGNESKATRTVIVEKKTPESGLFYTKLTERLYLNEKEDVAIYIAPDLNKSEKLIYNSAKIQEITQEVYRHFGDEFDFIMLVNNNKERPQNVTYAGVFLKVKNDVEGIGAPLYSNSSKYGSQGKLKGVMHFAYRSAILRGPTLHEISHYWANKLSSVIKPVYDADRRSYDGYYLGSGAHWGYTGFFGGKGQLGGYDANVEELRDENLTYDGKKITWNIYSATPAFGWNANGGNSLPYNDVELYLMGMIPKDQVRDLMVPMPWGSSLAPDIKDYYTQNNLWERGRVYFMAQSIVRKSWDEILSENNIPDRNPSAVDSQKSFRVLTVLLDTGMPAPHEVNVVSTQIESLAYAGDDGDPRNYNFWEATRGKGTLQADKLSETLINAGEEVKVADEFVSETISFRGREYKTVQSPYTGRIWLDRNLGAEKVCEGFDDQECYGYLFAFGRGYDGHQERNSPITTERKDSLTGNDNRFVSVGNTLPTDWVKDGVDDDLSRRIAFFSESEGGGICPTGYRTPTVEEIKAETLSNEFGDPFPGGKVSDNFLKLPFSGYRNSQSSRALIMDEGSKGAYWTASSYVSSSSGETLVRELFFDGSSAMSYGTVYFSNANAVRCIAEKK